MTHLDSAYPDVPWTPMVRGSLRNRPRPLPLPERYAYTLVFRPLRWLRNMVVLSVSAFVMMAPGALSASSSNVPPMPPRQEDPSVLAHRAEVARVYAAIRPRMTKSDDDEALRVAEAIVSESRSARYDPLFVMAIIDCESGWDIEAVSPTGARGLMQIIPGTWKRYRWSERRMFDPVENVRVGVRLLGQLRDDGFRRPETILLAYNQGPVVALDVYKNGADMPTEGASYVPAVMDRYRKLLRDDGRNPRDARSLFAWGFPDRNRGGDGQKKAGALSGGGAAATLLASDIPSHDYNPWPR